MFNGKVSVASKIITNSDGTKLASSMSLSSVEGALEGFVIDAWLANWDVVGMAFDNMLVKDKRSAVRVDTGGALRYRASGGLKGEFWGPNPVELTTMQDRNPSVFGDILNNVSQLKKSLAKLADVSDIQIREAVMQYGPLDPITNEVLVATLQARREALIKEVKNLVGSG